MWIDVDRTVIEHAHGFRVIATRTTNYQQGTTEIRRVIPIEPRASRSPSLWHRLRRRLRDWHERWAVRRGEPFDWTARGFAWDPRVRDLRRRKTNGV